MHMIGAEDYFVSYHPVGKPQGDRIEDALSIDNGKRWVSQRHSF